MKKGILFLNGIPPAQEYIENAKKLREEGKITAIYCTDGAYRYVSGTLLPDVVVGDFDSYSKSDVCSECECITFSADKDYTDGFLAVKIMTERGFTDIDIFGAYGGRPDMAESNLFLLSLAVKCGVRARFCGEMSTYLVKDKFTAQIKKGATISVVPFTDSLHILHMKGLRYALSDYTMTKFDTVGSPGYIMGVSNESLGDTVELEFSEGMAFVFVQE